MAKTYRVAVFGRTGKGNYGHGLDTVWAEIPQATVVAVADEHEAGRLAAQLRLKAPAAYADYRELLARERPDLVAIGPRWIDQHRDMAVAAAEAGAHIFMEKPFVRSLREADEVVRACEMRHIKLALAHQSHYSPVIHRVKALIAEGAIGDLLELRGRGKEDQRGGGEDLWVLGSHVLDLMRYFAGDALDCAATVSVGGRPVRAGDVVAGNEGLGPLAGDAVHARYNFAHGVVGYFSSVRGKGGSPSRFGLQLFGSKGVIEVVFGYLEPAWLLADAAWSPGRSGAAWVAISSAGIGKPEPLTGQGLAGGNVAAVNDLLAAIEGERQPLCNMYDGRAVTEMILGVFESHRLGRPVAFPLETRDHPLTLLG
jgi:predicted dehydrogenase